MSETIMEHAAECVRDCSSPNHQPQSKQSHKHLNITTVSPREDLPELPATTFSQEDTMAELPETPVHPAQSVGFFRMSTTLSLARLEANPLYRSWSYNSPCPHTYQVGAFEIPKDTARLLPLRTPRPPSHCQPAKERHTPNL